MLQKQESYVGQLKDVWSHSITLPHEWLVDEVRQDRSLMKYLHANEEAIEFLDDTRLAEYVNDEVAPGFFILQGYSPNAFHSITSSTAMRHSYVRDSFDTLSIRRCMDGAKFLREFFYGITPSFYVKRNPDIRTYNAEGEPQTTPSDLDFAIIYQQFGSLNFAMKYREGRITQGFLDHYGNYYTRCVSRDKHLAISPSNPAVLLVATSESGSVEDALKHLRDCATVAVSSMVPAWTSHSPDSSLPPWAVIFGFVVNVAMESVGLYAYIPTSSSGDSGAFQEVHVDEFPFRSYSCVIRHGSAACEENNPIFLERLRFGIVLLVLLKHIVRLSTIWDSSTLPSDIELTENELGKAYSLFRPTPSPTEISSGDPFEEAVKWLIDVSYPKAIRSEKSGQSDYEDPVAVDLDEEARAELADTVERWRSDVILDPDAIPGLENTLSPEDSLCLEGSAHASPGCPC